MSIPLPRLDDLDFDELRTLALGWLPELAPSWTDHNPSDPGIMMVELVAWITDMLVYRVDQVSPEANAAFVELLTGSSIGHAAPEPVDPGSLSTHFDQYRVVTASDVTTVLHNQVPGLRILAVEPGFRRVGGTPTPVSPSTPSVKIVASPGHTLVVVDQNSDTQAIDHARSELSERRIVTTHFDVVTPRYRDFTVVLGAAAAPTGIKATLERYYDPRVGGLSGEGWPLGARLDANELRSVVHALPDVSPHTDVELRSGLDRTLHRTDLHGDSSLQLDLDELPHFVPFETTGTEHTAAESGEPV